MILGLSRWSKFILHKKVDGMRAFTLPLVLSTLNIFKPVLRTLGETNAKWFLGRLMLKNLRSQKFVEFLNFLRK